MARAASSPRRSRSGQAGQAMTEYILIVSMCLLVLVGTVAIFIDYVGDFYKNLVYIVNLPLP